MLKHVKLEDVVEPPVPPADGAPLDLAPLLGTWVNTNAETRGITQVTLAARGGRLTVQGHRIDEGAPGEWDAVDAEATYAASLNSRQATAFSARCSSASVETLLLANLSQGLLVVASFGTFRDGSARTNYFSREFFHR